MIPSREQKQATATGPGILSRGRSILFVTLVALGWASDNFDRKVLPVALPFIGQDFHVNSTELGALASIFFAFYAISQVPGGAFADRFGSKRLMVAAMVVWSVFTGLMGVGSAFWMLLAFQAAFGIGQGAWPGASMKFVSEVTSKRFRMTAYGAIQCITAAGSAVAPLAAGLAISSFGWRGMFVAYMGIGIVLAVVMWLVIPRRRANAAAGPVASETPRTTVRAGFRVLRSTTLWKFALMFVGIDIVMNGVTAWVPSYLIKVHHIDVVHAGLLSSIPGYFSAASMFIGGILFDRYFHSRQRWLMIPCMVISGLLVLAMAGTSNVMLFTVFNCAAMFVAFLTFQTVAGVPMRYCPDEVRGAATAFVNVGGAVGGFIAPIVAGALIDAYSFQVAFAVLAAGAIITVIASLISPQKPEQLSRLLSFGHQGIKGAATGEPAG